MFAEELIAMRNQRGWTQEETAAQMLVSTSTVANIESGYRAPTPAQAMKADEVFGTPGTFQRHERRMRGIPFSVGFRPFQPHEAAARLIKTFQHSLVPGLFQTRAYAEAITEMYPETTAEIAKERVEGRMARQAILFREDDPPPPRVHALLDEQVLGRNVGGPAVMAEQMDHLAELAMMPRISIQVIPADRPHAGLLGAFVIAETDQPPAIVYLDSALDGQVVESANVAETIDVVFRALQMEALTGSVSQTKIKEAAQRWKEQITP
ncbi:MAG: helix-turn-helix transcriptional regulator [Actinobacteria bacterium]|nr:helix-turn-helix transcriptional regulator [Actinomycetota bacterium]